jgi:hypothetical protein
MRRMHTSHHSCKAPHHPTTDAPAAPHSRLANKAVGHQGRSSLIHELSAVAARFEPRSSSLAVPSTCPKQRFTAVANSQQRSVAVGLELRHRPLTGSLPVLPKLGVGPRWGDATLGHAGRPDRPGSTGLLPICCPRRELRRHSRRDMAVDLGWS